MLLSLPHRLCNIANHHCLHIRYLLLSSQTLSFPIAIIYFMIFITFIFLSYFTRCHISILVYPTILSWYPRPVIQNHIKKFCILRNAQLEQKPRKLEVLKHLLWLLHVFIFDSFLASFLFLIIVKIIFMSAQKCPYIYSKDEGHKYRLLMKIFYFSCKKYPFINTKRWEAFLQPPEENFLFFRLIEYLKTKKHSPIPGECLIKIFLFCCLWRLLRNACVSAKM